MLKQRKDERSIEKGMARGETGGRRTQTTVERTVSKGMSAKAASQSAARLPSEDALQRSCSADSMAALEEEEGGFIKRGKGGRKERVAIKRRFVQRLPKG